MDSTAHLLNDEDLIKLEQGQALDRDYFYIPVITYSEPSIHDHEMWYSLRFSTDEIEPGPPDSLMLYASKVPEGQTLWQAARGDLEKDFNYPHDKSFVIESARAYDTAKNKAGDVLTRVIVDIKVDEMFKTRNLHPLDMQLAWHFEGEYVFNPVWDYFDEKREQVSAEQFIKHCKTIVTDYEASSQQAYTGSAAAIRNSLDYPFKEPAHPMVYKVANLAFDIAEDYRSEKEDKADWDLLVKTLNNYIEGRWEPTCWTLTAMYGKFSGNKLVHSYSLSVNRQNGKTMIETATEDLKAAFKQIISNINTMQTDERFLQNLAKIAPQEINKYELLSVRVAEYLTEPYYSTAG